MLHKRSGWVFAAKAVMERGLPTLEDLTERADVTQHINAVGQFAWHMADWLQKFAQKLHLYLTSQKYEKHRTASLQAPQKQSVSHAHRRSRCSGPLR